MTLGNAIDVATSSLATTAQLTSIASRNIANLSNKEATRKQGMVVTDDGGGTRIGLIGRTVNSSLQDSLLGATSNDGRLSAVVSALDALDLTSGGTNDVDTPASRITDLRSALQTYSSNTADQGAAAGVFYAASDTVATLRSWAKTATDVRLEADTEIRTAVDQINTILKQVGELNSSIVNGTIAKSDTTDQLDARDAMIAKIAEQIGVTVVSKPNNGIALYTDSGITLFDSVPREVSVQNVPLTDGAPGGRVTIDGVPAIGNGAVMPVSSGRIAGLVEVRDTIVPAFSAQLDDVAASLIRAFAETDQSAMPTQPDLAGLFTASGMTTPPAAGGSVPGLAKAIMINPNVDPAQGGNLMRLRDGGISDPLNIAYSYNATGVSGYNGRAQQLVEMLSQTSIHDPASSLPGSASVIDYASSSAGWLQGQRKTHSQNAEYASTLLERSQQAFGTTAGINIDDEMAQLLGLERSYQASAKLISTADSMFAALMQAIG